MTNGGTDSLTLASTWRAVVGSTIDDGLLTWPPDVFALTDVLLHRSEAFRFTLGPPGEWPPAGSPGWAEEVERAATLWRTAAERSDAPPDLVVEAWHLIARHADVPLEHLAQGREPVVCEALLTLHAVADEACAGLGVALDSSDADAGVYRARGRELLVRTGSMARLDPHLLRVLPKVRTPPTGRAAHSRYACVQDGVPDACWHKVPARHRGSDVRSEFARILLLPWPLRVRASDFRPADGGVRRPDREPYAFFEFAPREALDLDLLDRVLTSARDEAGGVDVVYLPESAVDATEIAGLEALLHRHGVVFLQAGVREHSPDPTRFPGSAIHIGINPLLEKGASRTDEPAPPWWHIRQGKHHRWSLDRAQIDQYHLGGQLHPQVRWWEAVDVPRQAVQFVEVAELTLACLVCEDLAQNDDVAELIRAVGPTIVFPALLDGPQLGSRWASRYASGLADDPGSAVLTLTSYGMVARSRPNDRAVAPVVALWKDSTGGFHEIPLEAGAHAVLLTVCMDRATRRSADGRAPANNGTECFAAAIHQVRARAAGADSRPPAAGSAASAASAALDVHELTVLTCWAEAVAEALAYAPERTAGVVAEARADAAWRKELGLEPPTPRLDEAITDMASLLAEAAARGEPTRGALIAVAERAPSDTSPIARLVRRVLIAMVEERSTRLT
ncbi:hypothetical protein [Actinomycetospora sp. NBRC 106375]|uniref:hypothetical protein n=1 Tax=Actinomycetospora sp. NBRC 106375 TaxID=3032207 RepID=UPI002553627C|nr:hypothetical protein [Actinomycetospora sp. NBRC 106375]